MTHRTETNHDHLPVLYIHILVHAQFLVVGDIPSAIFLHWPDFIAKAVLVVIAEGICDFHQHPDMDEC